MEMDKAALEELVRKARIRGFKLGLILAYMALAFGMANGFRGVSFWAWIAVVLPFVAWFLLLRLYYGRHPLV